MKNKNIFIKVNALSDCLRLTNVDLQFQEEIHNLYRQIENGKRAVFHRPHPRKETDRSPARKSSIKNRMSIEQRPAIVEEKSRIGD